MKKTLKIGLYRNSQGNVWHGGQIYFDNLISLLSEPSQKPIELLIIENERGVGQSKKVVEKTPVVYFEDYFSEEEERVLRSRKEALRLKKQVLKDRRKGKWWDRFFPQPKQEEPYRKISIPKEIPSERLAFAALIKDCKLDFVFPLPPRLASADVVGADWVPDLQHCFLPELFDQADIEYRNKIFRQTSESGVVVFSSSTARDDFQKRYPDASASLEVWSFCGNPGGTLFESDPSAVRERYRLPAHFFVVANQFWRHKDHALVIEALVLLRNEGLKVNVVFTGALQDYRDTAHIDEFLQSIQRGGLHENVFLLGFLDRAEQWHLMRSALAVIQPSRFEGWSTVVEDCKAIGQRLILSDLKVHAEQAPDHSLFFPVGDARLLADRIREFWSNDGEVWLSTRGAREAQAHVALKTARAKARRNFLDIVEKAQNKETTSNP